ncbi:hypothetical protein [Microbacterium sp. NPDC089695]|uniref:hypothetical protein n=1 Tax=Microbacterium sp. NPDC089695 TaxID=3364198 RepID=UPI003815B00E
MRKKNEDNMPEDKGSKKPASSQAARKASEPLGDADLKVTSIQDMYLSPKRQCTAMSKHTGQQCGRYAMKGLRVCVMHGGATRQAKAKAAERIQQASGYAADLLVEMMANPDIDVKTRTQIAQDLLNRAGVSERTVLQIGVEQPKSFLDFVGDALVDVADDDDSNIVDAVVIEDDDAPLMPRNSDATYEGNRHDRALDAQVERARSRDPKRALSQVERARMEAAEREVLSGAPANSRSRRAGGRSDDDAAMAEQQDREDNELRRVRRAERERNADRAGDRHPRNAEATMTQPNRRKRR